MKTSIWEEPADFWIGASLVAEAPLALIDWLTPNDFCRAHMSRFIDCPPSAWVICLIALMSYALTAWAGHKLGLGQRLPYPFRDRTCQGKGWRHAFLSASNEEIREFLALFVKAFAFRNNEKLKFNPEDQILRIYRALYPSKWTPDALEVETLAMSIKKKYGVSLEHEWRTDLTLGELFDKTRGARPATPIQG